MATITDPNYTGSASGTLVIAKANQTITFAALANKTFGDPPFSVSATATSGLTVTFAVGASDKCTIAGATVTLTGAGSCTVTASQAGDANYNAAAPVAQSFTIAPAAATVTLNGLSQTYDGTPRVVTATTSPTGLTVTITYDGSATAPTNAGSYAVVGTISDPNYTGSASGTLVVGKADQTITFAALADKTFGDADFTVSATASSEPGRQLRGERQLHRDRQQRPPDRRGELHDHRLAGGQHELQRGAQREIAPSRSRRARPRWP